MAKQVVKRSPAFLRREAIKRRQRKKSHRDESSAKPNWVDKLKRSYNPDADKMKKPKGASWAKKQKDADSDMDDDLGSVSDVGEGMEVESEIDEEKVTRLNEVQPLDTQLFVRGLPSDADVEHLKTVFGRFGHTVRRVLPVINTMTKRASGAAFVHFDSAKGADAVLNHAIANAREMTADEKNNDKDATDGLSHHQAKKLLFKLKQDRFTSKEPFMTILGTRVTVMRPLSRDETQDMTSGGKDKKAKRTPTGADDPRNLYLLREGVIEPDTPAAEGLNPRFLASLQRDYETRKHQLRNVNLFVSRTRLSVRNIPRQVDTKQLRALFLDQVRALIKQRPELKDKKSWGKFGPIKNVKVLVDSTGASKGYGFVEFVRHEYALYSLRLLNNNPTTFGPNSRLVVAFAVENVNALQKMERMKLLRKQREEQRKRSGFEDDEGDEDGAKQSAVRRLIDKADDAAARAPSAAGTKAASITAAAKTSIKRTETKKTPRSMNTRKSAARKRVNNERVNRK